MTRCPHKRESTYPPDGRTTMTRSPLRAGLAGTCLSALIAVQLAYAGDPLSPFAILQQLKDK